MRSIRLPIAGHIGGIRGQNVFALAERHRIEQAREEGSEGARRETGEMLMALNAAARTNRDLLPSLLQEYQEKYQNGTAIA